MKKCNRHIFYTWIVLVCFAAGQALVFAHQHLVKYNTHQTCKQQQTIKEKCQLCDAAYQHNPMALFNDYHHIPAISAVHFYTQGRYDFVSISLILSAGRAPPIS